MFSQTNPSAYISKEVIFFDVLLIYIFRLEDYAGYFELVNKISDPHNIIEILFPLISIIDSVFATQLIFVMAFGGWLNSIIKW